MDNLEKDRQIIKKVLTDYLIFLRTYSHLESKLIVSKDRNNYLILIYGLLEGSYFHDFIIHLEILEGIIHLRRDDIDIEDKLLKSGFVPGKLCIYGCGNPFNLDFAISLEKIYELHKSIFASGTNPKQPIINPNATPEELIELSKIENKYISSAIAQHPNIPLDLLLKLFPLFPGEIFTNPSFNLFMQNKPSFLQLLSSIFPSVYEFSQLDFVLPDFFIEWALEQKDKYIRAWVIQSHKIPLKYVEKLINDDDDCRTIAYLICRMGIPCENNFSSNYFFSQDIADRIWDRYSHFQKICQQKDEYGGCNGDCYEITSSM